MADELLEITLSPTGEITIETLDFHGPSCLSAAVRVAEWLGRETSRTLKPEFDDVPAETLVATRLGAGGLSL